MLNLDLRGKRALVAGVADDVGLGFAIAKALATAGASVCVATWPPALGIFRTLLERGKLDESKRLPDGSVMQFEQVYALDVDFDTLEDAPAELKAHRRYRDVGDFSINGLAQALAALGPQPLDVVIHALANGPEVKSPLLATTRRGYLAAQAASAYSLVALTQALAPLMRPGGAFLTLSYLAAQRAVPGYGGGMSSAKAALEADVRLLAYEIGRQHGLRINAISAGPYKSRAAAAIGAIDSMIAHAAEVAPLSTPISAAEVAAAATFLVSPLASGITGQVIFCDHGYSIMGA